MQPELCEDNRNRNCVKTIATPRAGDETPRAGDETPRAGDETRRAGDETPRAGDETPRAGDETPWAGDESSLLLREFRSLCILMYPYVSFLLVFDSFLSFLFDLFDLVRSSCPLCSESKLK